MNNEKHTIEVLKRAGNIEAPKELLQATLKKMKGPIKSPYVFSYVQKIGVAFAALLVVVTGGVAAHRSFNPSEPASSTTTAYNDVSDGALSQDISNIDDQMSGLDADSAYVDQAMSDQNQ